MLQNLDKTILRHCVCICDAAQCFCAFFFKLLLQTLVFLHRDAFSHVQERRFCINPNVGFVHQLQVQIKTHEPLVMEMLAAMIVQLYKKDP